jgi:hypothetical protein
MKWAIIKTKSETKEYGGKKSMALQQPNMKETAFVTFSVRHMKEQGAGRDCPQQTD